MIGCQAVRESSRKAGKAAKKSDTQEVESQEERHQSSQTVRK
jgi:hypothetical protein